MRRAMLLCAVAGLGLGGASPSLAWMGSGNDTESLAGIDSFEVLILGLDFEELGIGLTEELLIADVESRLGFADSPATGVSITRWYPSPGDYDIYLYIDVMAYPSPRAKGTVTYLVAVEFYQSVRLERDPSILAHGARTWGARGIGVVPLGMAISKIREMVDLLAERFCNDFLEANPPSKE